MRRTKIWSAIAIALGTFAATGLALGAQGGNGGGGGGGGGGGKPPVELSNNLSFPSVLTAGVVALPGVAGEYSLNGVFPTSMSFGCATPEIIGTSEYPNTSCVTTTGVPLSYTECQTKCGAVPVDRIYWQKNSLNAWQAQTLGFANGLPGTDQGPQIASFLDWGDNLEVVTWTASSNIRVETTPFAVLGSELVGFQMWHVFGQGPDEMWGVRATDPADLATPGQAYGYSTAYAIIRSPSARLNFAKLETGTSACATPSPYAGSYAWNPATGMWNAIQVDDVAYTPELNIGGKFVYGYNWMTKKVVMPSGVDKTGWWRLTFHAPDVLFSAATVITPPVLPDSAPLPTSVNMVSFITPTADEGPLYVPVVDPVNHITYIDICLAGGRGNSGKPK